MSFEDFKAPEKKEGGETIESLRLRTEHKRGKKDPIPAGTVGVRVRQKGVQGLRDHFLVRFDGYGTYYVPEEQLEEVSNSTDQS